MWDTTIQQARDVESQGASLGFLQTGMKSNGFCGKKRQKSKSGKKSSTSSPKKAETEKYEKSSPTGSGKKSKSSMKSTKPRSITLDKTIPRRKYKTFL